MGKKRYETKIVAQNVADSENKKDATWFCPLIDGICNKKCVCFVSATVEYDNYPKNTVNPYVVIDGFCDNSMFWGSNK